MRKVKTLLSALFMLLASALITACSCTDATITQVYETGISIRCTTDTVDCSKNEESGDLTIRCYKNDRFTIEYTLAPANVTTTQVDWEFSDNSGILSSSTFSYSKSATESITFTASNKGETTITFTTKATGKKVNALVKVSEERGKLPALDAPSGFEYNPATGTVIWDHVTKVLLNGQLKDATLVDGKAKGLVAYRVTVSEYKYDTKGIAYIDPATTRTEEVVSNQYTGLEKGKTYAIKAAAVGNDYDAKTGEESSDFFFHHIPATTDLSNSNGTISFTSPLFSAKSNIYCEGVDDYKTESPWYPTGTPINKMGGTEHKINYSVFGNRDTYTIKVISYPTGDYTEAKGYSEINNIRYYPSVASSTITIKRLTTPEISLENVTVDNVTIGGTVFNAVNTSSRLKLLGKDGNGITAADTVKYQYFVLSRDVNPSDYRYIDEIEPSFTGNTTVGSTGVTVYITADSAVDLIGGANNVVFVRLVGNASTTIVSEWTNFAYHQLGKVYNPSLDTNTGITETGIDGLDVATWSINNNIISIVTEGAGCVEFYFVNMNPAEPSEKVLVENTSYRITDAGLAPGQYKIYARLIGQFNASAKTLTGVISNNPISYFQVLNAPETTEIAADGTVKFKTVFADPSDPTSEIKRYTITLTKGNTNSVSLAEGADLNESVNGEFIVPVTTADGSGYRSFNIFDVARVILSKADNRAPLDIPVQRLDEYLESEGSFSYTIVANDNGTGSNVISSPSTSVINFTRVKSIQTIQLQGSNSLRFESVSNKYVVILESDSGDVYSVETTGDINGSEVVINLANLESSNKPGKILDYVGDEGQVSFRVYAIGGTGKAGITGRINSIETSITFDCSAIPTSLSMDASGVLSWLSTTGREDDGSIQDIDASYQVTFYVDGVLKTADTKFTEQSTGTPHSDEEHYIYSLDISDILAKYEGQTVGIKVLEIVSAKFAGKASEMFYAIKLTTANLTKGTSGAQEPIILWNAVEYATGYTLSCSQNIFSGEASSVDFTSASDLSYQIPADLNLGSYTFTVVAYGANTAISGTLETAPYIITSSATATGDAVVNNPVTQVTVADGKLQASARGTSVVWKDIPGATYTVDYKLKTDSTFTVVATDDIISLDNTAEKYFSFASVSAGEYEIRIVPAVEFVSTGVILKDAGSISYLTKIPTVDSATITTNQGLLEFAYSSDKEVTIQLYTVGAGDPALISTSSYTQTISEGKYIIELFGITSGERNIALKVLSTGCIDSDLSGTYTMNKIEAVKDFEKVGDYLQWKPVEGTGFYATNYEIVLDGNNKQTLKVTKDGSNYICYVLVDDGGTLTGGDTPADASVFTYTGGIFKFKPETITAPGQYSYKIRATITTTGYINSNTASTTVTKLHNEVTVVVGDAGVIEYGAYAVTPNNEPTSVIINISRLKEVTEGEGYEVDTAYATYTTTIAFSEYSAVTTENGKYVIDIATLGIAGYDAEAVYGTNIKFTGNGGSIIDSEVSDTYTFDKLATTSAIKSEAGELSWVTVESAERYSVEILDASDQVVATFDYVLDGEAPAIPSVITNNAQGVSNLTVKEEEEPAPGAGEPEGGAEGTLALAPATSFTFITDEVYKIRVMAKMSGALNSKWSNTFSFKKLKPVTNLNISRTDTIEREDGTIVYIGAPALYWENPNSETVNLQVNYFTADGVDLYQAVTPFQSSEKQYFELSANIPAGDYAIRMQALGNTSAVFGLLNSDMSEIVETAKITYISNNTAPEISNGKITWSGIPSAYTYRVRFTNVALESYETYKSGTELDLNVGALSDILVDRLGYGYWDVKVTAVTDPKLGIVSDHADTTHIDTIAVYRPGQLGNYKIKNGMLSWTVSYDEINAYMDRVTLPEGTSLVANELISYIIDMAIKGESVYSETYGAVPMEHFYMVNLNINGVNTQDCPTAASVLNSSGEVVTDYRTGSMIEFVYDVSIETDFSADSDEIVTTITNSAGITYNAGYYEIYVNPVGDSTVVLDGAKTGTISAYKLTTPKSWYDSVSVEIPLVDEFGAPMLDGEGNQIYETVTSRNDIANGKALWELSVINSDDGTNTMTYHKDYTLRAVTKDSETRNTVKVTVGNLENEVDGEGNVVPGGERDPNIYDDYKYSRDIKELFYDDEANRVALDTVYRLFILANGTVDSTDPDHTGINFLNSNTYMFSDTMTILTTDKPAVTNGQITWNYSQNSTSSKLKIYGPLNILDGELVEDEGFHIGGFYLNRNKWKTEEYTKEELAKLRYLDGVDPDIAFDGITPARKLELIEDANSNLLEYQKRIKVIDLSAQEGSRANQYTLTDNPSFGTGGYAIYKQEIGDGRGIVDSPISDIVYAYKLGTTSATRQLAQTVTFDNGSSTTASMDYWLGQNDTAGMFVWKHVPLANAYKLTLRATNVAEEGEDSANSVVVLDNIIVRGREYYEPAGGVDLNKPGYKYSLDIVATSVINVGTPEVPEYQVENGFFDSNRVDTTKANTVYNPTDAADTKMIISGRYFRLDIPTNIVVNDRGQISWNDGTIYVGTVNNYALSYQFSGTHSSDATDDNTPQIDILDSVLGSISIRVKAIAVADSGYINSSYSNSASVTKIAPPVPRVTDGVFEWSTAGDVQASQSVTASILTIDGTTVPLKDNTVLSYPYFTDITLDNQSKYSVATDTTTFPAGNHTITIMYKGTEGSSDDVANLGKQFYLASELRTYYVNKLSAPTLKNVINTNANEENRISWTWDDSAVAYRLKFFVDGTTHVYTIIKEESGKGTIKIINPNVAGEAVIYDLNWDSNDYFETDGAETRFKLNTLLQSLDNANANDGLQIFAFAQAIGNLQTSTYNGVTGLWETTTKPNPSDPTEDIEIGSVETYRALLSSSYSDRLVISIPSSPTNAQYDSETGTLTWSMTNVDDIYTGYNIILNVEYQVNAVSEADKNSWVKSAHKAGAVNVAAANFAAANTNADFDADYLYYDEIKERVVVYYLPTASTEYVVYVRDTILVNAYRSGAYTMTPTSYKLTSIASNYKFALTATAYDSTEMTSNSYKSSTYVYNVEASFSLFYSGNGSPYLPYIINNETRLNNIRKYTDSYYELMSDIYVEHDWSILENFSGQIDGAGHIIYNVSATSYSDGTATYQSFILNNNGVIKDVKFQINYTATSTAYQYQVAGVVINNMGTLDNVHIVTYYTYNDDDSIKSTDVSSITVTTTTNAGIFVGGLVLDNRGTISNSSVVANITALENGNGATATAVVGGIARKMSGTGATITNCYFGGDLDKDSKRISGTIKANQIGGIVESIEQSSTVTRCYITEDVEFTVTDKSFTANNGIYRGGRIGGIVGAVMSSDVTIDMCYSLAKIVIDAASSGTKSISIGGIVADCPVVSTTNVRVTNCYTVVRNVYATGSTTNGHYAYAICYTIDRISTSNCYYYVDFSLSNRVTLNAGYGSECDDIPTLSSTMVALGYTATGSYPTLG